MFTLNLQKRNYSTWVCFWLNNIVSKLDLLELSYIFKIWLLGIVILISENVLVFIFKVALPELKTPALEYKLLKMAKITNCFIFAFAFSVRARACRRPLNYKKISNKNKKFRFLRFFHLTCRCFFCFLSIFLPLE